jgi:hypothetical protein
MRVITAAGTIHKLDPHTMTAFRLPARGADLRREGERVQLLRWPEPVLGERMELHLILGDDGVPTIRRTILVGQVNYR